MPNTKKGFVKSGWTGIREGAPAERVARGGQVSPPSALDRNLRCRPSGGIPPAGRRQRRARGVVGPPSLDPGAVVPESRLPRAPPGRARPSGSPSRIQQLKEVHVVVCARCTPDPPAGPPAGGPDRGKPGVRGVAVSLSKPKGKGFPPRARFSVMILPQVHLRKPCYDFYFL